jgi:hypothetical protein
MSRQEKRESAPTPPSPAPTPEKSPQAEAEAAAPKPKYVFKIVPADPKNAFDFEDVADK